MMQKQRNGYGSIQDIKQQSAGAKNAGCITNQSWGINARVNK